MTPEKRLTYLFDRYLTKTNTPEEMQELSILILSSGNNDEIESLLRKSWDNISQNEKMPEEKASLIINSILKNGGFEKEKTIGGKEGKVIRLFPWRKIAVAASVLVILGFGGYLLFSKTSPANNQISKVIQTIKDVAAPTESKATITLSNGKKVMLDSVLNGTLAVQGGMNIKKLGTGQIVYSGSKQGSKTEYNVLENPRGSNVINLTLSDGSKVWLNSESSLRFPVNFVGKERRVEITGEAYFEVVHNASMPFHVSFNGNDVQDLGTHFNINAYTDEIVGKTTLLEGSVKIASLKTNSSITMSPGEQVKVNDEGRMEINKSPDLVSIMAWKNGKFIFQDMDLRSIMRQLARWYNVDVIYKGNISNEEYVGIISRDVNISEILKMLETTSDLKFDIVGKSVIVKN